MIHILWLEYVLVRGIRRIANVLCICCTNFVLNFWGETCLVQEISFSFRFHMVETTMTYYKCKLIYIVLEHLMDESNFECISYPKYHMYENTHSYYEMTRIEIIYSVAPNSNRHITCTIFKFNSRFVYSRAHIILFALTVVCYDISFFKYHSSIS